MYCSVEFLSMYISIHECVPMYIINDFYNAVLNYKPVKSLNVKGKSLQH